MPAKPSNVVVLPTKTKPAPTVVNTGPSFGQQILIGLIVGLILIAYQDQRTGRGRRRRR